MKTFNIKPFKRGSLNTPSDWVFSYLPYGCVSKADVAKKLLNIYPDLIIKKIHVVKSIKRILVIVSTDRVCPWN